MDRNPFLICEIVHIQRIDYLYKLYLKIPDMEMTSPPDLVRLGMSYYDVGVPRKTCKYLRKCKNGERIIFIFFKAFPDVCHSLSLIWCKIPHSEYCNLTKQIGMYGNIIALRAVDKTHLRAKRIRKKLDIGNIDQYNSATHGVKYRA